MSLDSLSLLPRLQRLPVDEEYVGLKFEEIRQRLVEMDRDHWSIETSAGVEKVLLGIFQARNVPDDLIGAHELSFSGSDLSLHEHYQEMLGRGDAAVTGFLSNLKGKVAELRLVPDLEQRYPGHTFRLSENPTQPVLDIRGIGPDGTDDIMVQVKMGTESYAPEVVEAIQEGPPNLIFAVSREIHERIAETQSELVDRLLQSDVSNLQFTEGIQDSLEILSQNLGIDLPDSVGDVLPFAGEVVLGIRLLLDIVAVEKDFKAANLSDRSRIHALKALMLISRFGVSMVLTAVGATMGSSLPGPGSMVGAIGGAAVASRLNRRLKPRLLDVAMMLAGVDEDDIFYFKNTLAVDHIGASLAATTALE